MPHMRGYGGPGPHMGGYGQMPHMGGYGQGHPRHMGPHMGGPYMGGYGEPPSPPDADAPPAPGAN